MEEKNICACGMGEEHKLEKPDLKSLSIESLTSEEKKWLLALLILYSWDNDSCKHYFSDERLNEMIEKIYEGC